MNKVDPHAETLNNENVFDFNEYEPSTSMHFNDFIDISQTLGTHCRLAKTPDEILNDPIALSYFINFLENIGRLSFIKFWLHVKSFQLSPTTADAINIYNSYMYNKNILELPTQIVCKIKDEIFCDDTSQIDSNLFDEAQSFVRKLIEHRYFKRYLHSVFYAKYQLEIFESRQLSLADVLRSHGLLSSFVEFLEEKKCRNLLEFVIAVESFVVELRSDESKMHNNHQEDAMLIYDRFISMQAVDHIGVDDKVRIGVETGICTESGVPKLDAFDEAKNVTIYTLQDIYIPAYLKSDNFTRLINEAQQNADAIARMSAYNKTIHHRHSNTYLPSTSSNSNSAIEYRRAGSQMRNYSQTCDSEIIWQDDSAINEESNAKRKKKCSSLAKIDAFGRYTSLFDNTLINEEDDGQISSRTRLKNALDKYLNQTAMKESVAADEMAELLIGEVRNMILAANLQSK